jgi:hypothetical protein
MTAVVVSLLVVALSAPGPAGPPAVAAACVKNWAVANYHNPDNSDGGRMTWKVQTLSATDWAARGFAAQVLWAGTNNVDELVRWVEVGVTKGWQGQTLFTNYSAHGNLATEEYGEARITAVTPVVGNTDNFLVNQQSTVYGLAYVGSVDGHGLIWTTHSGYSKDYQGGLEATCNNSRVDRVYVQSSQRHRSAGVWISPSAGTLMRFTQPEGQPVTGTVAWCGLPKFRYAMNSSIDPNLCS